jgi:hypothetical protein
MTAMGLHPMSERLLGECGYKDAAIFSGIPHAYVENLRMFRPYLVETFVAHNGDGPIERQAANNTAPTLPRLRRQEFQHDYVSDI